MTLTITARRAAATVGALVLACAALIALSGHGAGGRAGAVGAPASIRCTGAVQGTFTKDTVNGLPLTQALITTNHAVSVPTDPSSGLATGRRVHRPYTFTKLTDSSTVNFLKAEVNSENLTCTVRYFKVNSNGTTSVYYTVQLSNAHVSSYSFSHGGSDTESWSLSYQSISWTMGTSTLQDCPSCTA